ncbi:hypothetical protein [Aureimonas sp. SA4125]|uniref:hypothetical protein n=1 Tax=Aureimonas sp. SA4125 TaxID=2826993 RepID=UPI001CC3A557|nr:hypothetical protein [Aureimonas sp. SA4125]
MPAARKMIKAEFGYDNVDDISAPVELYRKMGAARYDCIDLDGHRGAHVFDLNLPLDEAYGFTDTFDFVTNHGTTEHLFNQMVAFENVHKLAATDGLILHALPFQGYQNHGMFNYNASLFLDLSISNDYEVFGLFLSVDDKLFAYDEDFLSRNNISTTSDVLIMAVMRKTVDRPFEAPYDGRYFRMHGKGDVAPLESVGSTRRFGGREFTFTGLDDEKSLSEDGGTEEEAADQPVTQFLTPIWGMAYVERYLSVTLPSQLSKGNLQAYADEPAVYTIVTQAPEMEAIKASPHFKTLKALMPVEFVMHEPLDSEHAYVRMTRCYNIGLSHHRGRSACFFLTADDYYSASLFSMAKKAVASGKRVVMVPTIRVVAESFEAELLSNDEIHLEAPDVVGMMLRHEHPMITACVVNNLNRDYHELPSQTIYRLPNGYIGRWNVMHPLVVVLPTNPKPIRSTVDWNYPALYVSKAADIHIVRDSDHGAIASLTEWHYDQDRPVRRNAARWRRVRNLKDWIDTGWPINFHLLQMDEPVHIHAGPRDPGADAGMRAVDAVWKPFRRYVVKHETFLPPATKGFTLYLLTPAVQASKVGLFFRRIRIVRHRKMSTLKQRVYQSLMNRFR